VRRRIEKTEQEEVKRVEERVAISEKDSDGLRRVEKRWTKVRIIEKS
jgi:hypothetical protein